MSNTQPNMIVNLVVNVTPEMLVFAVAYSQLTRAVKIETFDDLLNEASVFIQENGSLALEEMNKDTLDEDHSIVDSHLATARQRVMKIVPTLFNE